MKILHVSIINTYLQDREFAENRLKLFCECVFGEHDLTHVKCSNPSNLETRVDNGRSLTLCLGQNYVQEVICGRYRRDRRLQCGRHVACTDSGKVSPQRNKKFVRTFY